MNLSNRLCRLIVALLFTAFSAVATPLSDLQDLVLTGDLNGRTSVDFRKGTRNIQFTIPLGSTGQILETRKLRGTGSYGVKIRLTSVNGSRGKNSPRVGDETWVYFSQRDPWLTFKDKDGADVDDPEVALVARARRDGIGLPIQGVDNRWALPTKAEVLREQKPKRGEDLNLSNEKSPPKTEAGLCTNCQPTGPSLSPRTRDNVEELTKGLQDNSSPESLLPSEWSRHPEVLAYSNGAAVEKSISYGMRNHERQSKRLCYRYVKRAILGGDLVDDYLPGNKARYGISDLKRRGFINMLDSPRYKEFIKSPEDAPKGAILIYRNRQDPHHAGHIEIKTDWGFKGGYVSDFYRSTFDKLHNRELIGVMIKGSL